jgi:uncharacterized membrane protein YphA (DoxX/SURF4 family)
VSAGWSSRHPLTEQRVALALRLIAGAILIYASYDKLFDAQSLADAIDDYRILPLALVDLSAIILPWVELVTGLCLIVGVGTTGAGLVTAALAAVYTGAMSSALLRGLEIGCGCFGGESGAPLSWPGLWLRMGLFAAGVQIAVATRALDWPAAALSSRATRSRHARGPTPGA